MEEKLVSADIPHRKTGKVPAGGTSPPPPPTINFPVTVKPALRMQTVLRAIHEQKPALRVELAPATLLCEQRPAISMVQIQWDLAHESHVVTAANDVGNVQNWTTPANMQGAPDSAHATFASGPLQRSGKVRGTAMATQANRPASLLIKEVYLQFHYRTQGFLEPVPDLVSNLALGYRINTSPLPTLDFVITNTQTNEDHLANGVELNIANGGVFFDTANTPATWANIALLQPFLAATCIANPALGIQFDCDAVRLRVVAQEIQTI